MTKSPGQVGYDAYGETAGWTTYDGRPMPRWEALGASVNGRETQRRWEVAATAVTLQALAGPRRAEMVRALGEMLRALEEGT